MEVSKMLDVFEKGGYTLLVLVFFLYFGWRYINMQLRHLEIKLREELRIKKYKINASIEDDMKGGFRVHGDFVEYRDD